MEAVSTEDGIYGYMDIWGYMGSNMGKTDLAQNSEVSVNKYICSLGQWIYLAHVLVWPPGGQIVF